jgi:TPR repeat protein
MHTSGNGIPGGSLVGSGLASSLSTAPSAAAGVAVASPVGPDMMRAYKESLKKISDPSVRRASQFEFSRILLQPNQPLANRQQGLKLLRKTAESGLAEGQYLLAEILSGGFHGMQSSPTSHHSALPGADDSDSWKSLGGAPVVTSFGGEACHALGLSPNKKEALGWVLAAAKQGLAPALYMASVMTKRGDGCSKSEARALGYVRRAAALGHLEAMVSFFVRKVFFFFFPLRHTLRRSSDFFLL